MVSFWASSVSVVLFFVSSVSLSNDSLVGLGLPMPVSAFEEFLFPSGDVSVGQNK